MFEWPENIANKSTCAPDSRINVPLGFLTWNLLVQERQGSKDGSSPCLFRLSSEGLPLLLSYITKQILCASLADFRHLLQYRTIKFADFVDAKFGTMASELMLGCCVVVLGEGKIFLWSDCMLEVPISLVFMFVRIIVWFQENKLRIQSKWMPPRSP